MEKTHQASAKKLKNMYEEGACSQGPLRLLFASMFVAGAFASPTWRNLEKIFERLEGTLLLPGLSIEIFLKELAPVLINVLNLLLWGGASVLALRLLMLLLFRRFNLKGKKIESSFFKGSENFKETFKKVFSRANVFFLSGGLVGFLLLILCVVYTMPGLSYEKFFLDEAFYNVFHVGSVAALFLVVGGMGFFEYLFKRREFLEEGKMTHQELVEEKKESSSRFRK